MWSTDMAGSRRVFRRPLPTLPRQRGTVARGLGQDPLGTIFLTDAPSGNTIRRHPHGRRQSPHPTLRRVPGGRVGWGKWGLLLPGAPEPRLTLLRRQGFRSVFQTALRGLSNRSIVVVCNYGLAR